MTSPTPITNLDTCIDNIVAHARTVAAAISTPITDVARADPVPKGRSIRVWWSGETVPPGYGAEHPAVLNGDLIGELVNVGCFWPIGDSAEVLASNRDKEVWAVVNALRAGLQADSTLSGTCTNLDVGFIANDYVVSNGSLWRFILVPVSLAFIEYPTSI